MYYGETPTVIHTLMVVAIFVNFIETENKLKFAHPLISNFNQFLYNLSTQFCANSNKMCIIKNSLNVAPTNNGILTGIY